MHWTELKVFKSKHSRILLPECFNLRVEKCRAVGLFNSTLMYDLFKNVESTFDESINRNHFKTLLSRFSTTQREPIDRTLDVYKHYFRYIYREN